MKQICCIILLCGVCGCTQTKVTCPLFEVSRISVLQSVNVRVTVTPEGDISVNYGNDGGGEQAGKMIGAAGKTLVK